MILIFAFISFFWLIVLWSKTGYYVYLWQVKEYRVDRMLVQLKEPFGYSLIVSKNLLVKAFLLVLFIFFMVPIGIGLVAAVYLLDVVIIGYREIRGGNKFPTLTFKSGTIFLLSWFSMLVWSLAGGGIISLLLLDMAVPFIVTLWVLLFKPVTYGVKQCIVQRAKSKRSQYKNLTASGITGSYGKTSAKEFLAHILAAKFKVAKTKEHQNTEIGSARAILDMPPDTEVLVAEMAAYKKGDIAEISQVAKPTIGIITAIGPQHLALFGSLETILETKFELAAALPKGSTLIVNWDNEYIKKYLQLTSYNLQLVKYSIEDKTADVYASDIKVHPDRLEFIVHYQKEKETFQVNLLGEHNVSNILAATAAALILGMNLADISLVAKTILPMPRTMHLHKGAGGIIFIDDSYNASVQGVKAALEYLELYKERKRIMVMPSLIELGEKGFIYHEELGQEIARHCDYAFITDTKFQEAFLRGWKSVRQDDANLHFQSDLKQLSKDVEAVIAEGAVVLFEGRVPHEIMRSLFRPLEN